VNLFRKDWNKLKLLKLQLIDQEINIPVSDQSEEDLWNSIADGSWEPQTLRLMSNYVTNKSIVLDVGGSIGETTIYLAAKAQQTVAIDPSPISIACLQNIVLFNEELAPKVTFIQCALSNKDGILFFGRGSKDFNSIHFGVNEFNVSVRALSIETLSKEFGDVFTFINMDIEGGEYRCVPAMRDFLKLHRPDFLLSLHPGFNAPFEILSSNRFIVGKILFRLYWQFRILLAVRGYKYCIDVKNEKPIPIIRLLSRYFLRGRGGNQCQILLTNTYINYLD
jgi:FkbM family methyltransferase